MTRRTCNPNGRPPLAALLLGVALLAGAVAAGMYPTVARANEASTAARSDLAELRTEVGLRIALLEKLGNDGLRIHLTVDGDRVTLAGEVRHRSSQELAEEVARGVKGVREVRNEIALEPSGAPDEPVARAVGHLEGEVADALLESKVKLRLLDHAGSPALKVEVEASDGVVSLRGTLPDREHRKIILNTARDTEGVERVIDLLKVP